MESVKIHGLALDRDPGDGEARRASSTRVGSACTSVTSVSHPLRSPRTSDRQGIPRRQPRTTGIATSRTAAERSPRAYARPHEPSPAGPPRTRGPLRPRPRAGRGRPDAVRRLDGQGPGHPPAGARAQPAGGVRGMVAAAVRADRAGDGAASPARTSRCWSSGCAATASPRSRCRPWTVLVNTVEYFVHHEDLRRAQPGWTPRELPTRPTRTRSGGLVKRLGRPSSAKRRWTFRLARAPRPTPARPATRCSKGPDPVVRDRIRRRRLVFCPVRARTELQRPQRSTGRTTGRRCAALQRARDV